MIDDHDFIRWGSVVPVGVPHRVTQDDYYNGVFIPKGSTVLANSWCVFSIRRRRVRDLTRIRLFLQGNVQ